MASVRSAVKAARSAGDLKRITVSIVRVARRLSLSRARRQFRTIDELDGDRPPGPVALFVGRVIADAVDSAEIAYHLFINALQIFQLARVVKNTAALVRQF